MTMIVVVLLIVAATLLIAAVCFIAIALAFRRGSGD
jgi:hypothetical protein